MGNNEFEPVDPGANFLQPDSGLNITGGIKNLFLSFLQEFFAQQQEHTWHPDESETDLLITDGFPEDLSVVEKRPIIVLNRSSITPMHISTDKIEKKKLNDGSVRYSDLFKGGVQLQPIAKDGLSAEQLSTRCMLALLMFRPILRKRGLHKLNDVSIGEESAVESDAEIVGSMVPVTVRYVVKFSWRLVREGQEAQKATSADICLSINDREGMFQCTDP